MSETIDTLLARVTEIENAGDAIIAILEDVRAQLEEALATGDLAAIQSVSDRLAAQTEELAAAAVAGTPAE